MTYNPRLSHAVFCLVFGAVLIATSGLWFSGVAAVSIGAAGFILCVYSIWIMIWLRNRESIEFYDSVTRLAEQLTHLDVDQWNALGIRFPTLRIQYNGEPVLMVENSGVRLDDFERFMNDSNARYVSPERNWSQGRKRRAWHQIMKWLEINQYIYPDSAAGSHSWLWRGNSYNLLIDRYITPHVRVGNLNAQEEIMTVPGFEPMHTGD